jgi:hypothetical protein
MMVANEAAPACPRCSRPMRVGRPMPVREHDRIRQARKSYYSKRKRWFYCLQGDCKIVIWDESGRLRWKPAIKPF